MKEPWIVFFDASGKEICAFTVRGMTDERKQVVAELRKHGLSNGSMGYHSGWMDEAADLIEHQAAENDALRAENKRIRQENVTHESYKMVLDELEQVKRERDAARKIANIVPDMCDGDCSGDMSCGIFPCPAYQPPDVLDNGTVIVGGCMVQLWDDERGVCAENGGVNDEH